MRTSTSALDQAAATTLSSKGQVIIPEEIGIRLGLEAGARFVVIADRDAVNFKRLDPVTREFSRLVARARQAARDTGLTRTDVATAVKKVRRSP